MKGDTTMVEYFYHTHTAVEKKIEDLQAEVKRLRDKLDNHVASGTSRENRSNLVEGASENKY